MQIPRHAVMFLQPAFRCLIVLGEIDGNLNASDRQERYLILISTSLDLRQSTASDASSPAHLV